MSAGSEAITSSYTLYDTRTSHHTYVTSVTTRANEEAPTKPFRLTMRLPSEQSNAGSQVTISRVREPSSCVKKLEVNLQLEKWLD